ncbi:MAG: SGNH/GDSL hydrolase family protein [Christensenellales bacterium]|jgi:lysophospholipase L1-like esterase
MFFEKNTTLLFTGDSITDADRARPVGTDFFNGLGRNYVSHVNSLLTAWRPDAKIRVLNTGVSGNTSRDLLARWQTDVLALRPDYVSVMIGINDVWRQFDNPLAPDMAVSPQEYRANMAEIIRLTLPAVRGMILMTPFFIEPRREDPMRARTDEYIAIIKDLATEHGLTLVDSQAAMDRVCAHVPTASLAWDRVHPSVAGHMVLARAFCEAAKVL